MPVELRKRKAPAEPAPPPPAKKKTNPIKAGIEKAKAAVTGKRDHHKKDAANGSASSTNIVVGSSVTLEGFGGEIETNDGVKTTFKKLVDASKAGVVVFTYPKASTPGCKQSWLPLDNVNTLRKALMAEQVRTKLACSATTIRH